MARVVREPPQDTPTADGIRLAGWWRDTDQGQRVRCELCPRGCLLRPGMRGFCFVRENLDGRMVTTTYGRSTGFCVDPIEKKPLDHFYPGTLGALLRHRRLQPGLPVLPELDAPRNRATSRPPARRPAPRRSPRPPCGWAAAASPSPTTIPIVWAEYAIDTAWACRQAGVKTVAVTSGYMTRRRPRALLPAHRRRQRRSERLQRRLLPAH